MASEVVAAVESISTLPQPSHITLLLKNHKSTTALSVSPVQSFISIKALLLEVLSECKVKYLGDPFNPGTQTPLPASPSQLELGVLADRKDASKGWVFLTDIGAVSSAATKKKAGDPNTPAGAGLVDGSWVAYRVSKPTQSNETGKEGDAAVDVDMEDDPGWDVILPDFGDELEEGQDEAGPS